MSKKLEGLKKAELLKMAKSAGITQAARLKKTELIQKIEETRSEKSKKTSLAQKPSRKRRQQPGEPLKLNVKLKPRSRQAVESDFSHPFSETALHREESQSFSAESSDELPYSYNQTKIILMVRDPYWCYAYWDISSDMQNQIRSWFQNLEEPRTVLRVYDVTNLNFKGDNANSYFDIDISLEARNWYLNVGKPDSSFLVDLGILDKNGKFYLIARSNVIRTPRDMPSDVIDEEWMSRDFELLYAISGGFKAGASSGELAEKVKRGLLFRSWMSSGAFSSRS